MVDNSESRDEADEGLEGNDAFSCDAVAARKRSREGGLAAGSAYGDMYCPSLVVNLVWEINDGESSEREWTELALEVCDRDVD